MTGKRTHYDNLQVARSASPEVIKAAYRSLSIKYHPDRNPGDERCARIMAMINEAYAVLSDPVRRKIHDEWIETASAPSSRDTSHNSDEVRPSNAHPHRGNYGRSKPENSQWAKQNRDVAKPDPVARLLVLVPSVVIAVLFVIGILQPPKRSGLPKNQPSTTAAQDTPSLQKVPAETQIAEKSAREIGLGESASDAGDATLPDDGPTARIPAAFVGEWNEDVSACGTGINDTRLQVTPAKVTFYASDAKVLGVQVRNAKAVRIRGAFSGEEGQTWKKSFEMVLSRSGDDLAIDGYTRHRCP